MYSGEAVLIAIYCIILHITTHYSKTGRLVLFSASVCSHFISVIVVSFTTIYGVCWYCCGWMLVVIMAVLSVLCTLCSSEEIALIDQRKNQRIYNKAFYALSNTEINSHLFLSNSNKGKKKNI